jgi:hypothetical protein
MHPPLREGLLAKAQEVNKNLKIILHFRVNINPLAWKDKL